jgi:hypothetical protein
MEAFNGYIIDIYGADNGNCKALLVRAITGGAASERLSHNPRGGRGQAR